MKGLESYASQLSVLITCSNGNAGLPFKKRVSILMHHHIDYPNAIPWLGGVTFVYYIDIQDCILRTEITFLWCFVFCHSACNFKLSQ